MDFGPVKRLAKRTRTYRAARWVNRNLLDRDSLRTFHEERAFYARFIRSGDLCFDVGANYGFKTEVFLSLGAKVVAFEPQDDCMKELRDRIGGNPRLVTRHTAVGSSVGTTKLYIDPQRVGSSLLKGWREPEGIAEVPITTLDREIQQHGVPRFCKIDVEGYELEVLKGLSRPIETVSFEFHKSHIPDALECLHALGRFGPIEVNVTSGETMRFAREDWWTATEFEQFLKLEIPQMAGYAWGDIFVRRRAGNEC